MVWRGRTVLLMILSVAFVSSLLTIMLIEPSVLERYGLSQGQSETPPVQVNVGGDNGGSTGEVLDIPLQREQWQRFSEALQIIGTRHFQEIGEQKLIDGAIKGMLEAIGDDYASFMDPEEAENYFRYINYSFEGIGAEVRMVEGIVTVASPIRGAPAESAGVMANDQILAVNGTSLEGLNLTEAIMKIRGPKGTQAKLTIRRAGITEPITIIVVRDEIPFETVSIKVTDDGIGVMLISQFSLNTVASFAAKLAELEQEGINGLVIDLRNNPGGALNAVLHMLEEVLPAGKLLVEIEYRNGRIEQALSKQGEASKPYPISVIINEGSASAAEIMASALREHHESVIVGKTSYGKGTVQNNYDLPIGDGSSIKLTVANWRTAAGKLLEGNGITPDVEVDMPEIYRARFLIRNESLRLEKISEDVANLQVMLKTIGYAPGRDDGYFDAATDTEVRKFQAEQGLLETGVINEATAEAMEAAVVEVLLQPDFDTQMQRALQEVRRMNGTLEMLAIQPQMVE